MADLAKTESKNFAFRKATSPQAFYLQAVMAIFRNLRNHRQVDAGKEKG